MKKTAVSLCLLFTLSAVSGYAQSVDLNTGIRNGAAYFEQNLQRGTSIAVLSVRSDSSVLSEYVIDELSSYLVNGRAFTVVDRQNMDAIQREMNYQLSGDVSDETAQSIGKRIGAQTVITGSVQPFGNEWFFTGTAKIGLGAYLDVLIPQRLTITAGGQTSSFDRSAHDLSLGINGLIGPVFLAYQNNNISLPIAFGFHLTELVYTIGDLSLFKLSFGLGSNITGKYHITKNLFLLAGLQLSLDFFSLSGAYSNNLESAFSTGWGINPAIGIGFQY